MKKLASLLAVAVFMAAGSQVFGQAGKYYSFAPAAAARAREAYYIASEAYWAANREANYWETVYWDAQPYASSRTRDLAHYWRESASRQYGALYRMYFIWHELEEGTFDIAELRFRRDEAEQMALGACWYALAASSLAGNLYNPAMGSATESYQTIAAFSF